MKLVDLQLRLFVRNLEAGYLWENFLISAIASLLSLRVLLQLTGYPILGGGNIHVAHMLFGGLFMMVAILLLILFLNREAKQLASVIGGFGFGIFIDELGKFITSNHDYFFRPTIAMIYVIFMCLFFVVRASEKYIKLSPKDYAINALEILKDVVSAELDEQEKRRAINFLKKSDSNNPIVQSLRKVVDDITITEEDSLTLISRLKREVRKLYLRIVYHRWFTIGIIIFFVGSSFLSFIQAIITFRSIDSFFDTGHIFSSIIAGILVIIGTYILQRGHRYLAFEMYKYAVLVNIFLTQFFMFYQEQLSAIVELFGSITIYIVF